MKDNIFNVIIVLFSIVTYCNACRQKCLICFSAISKKSLYMHDQDENPCVIGIMKKTSGKHSAVTSETCSVCGMEVEFTFDNNQNESLKNLKYDMIIIKRKCVDKEIINYNCGLAKYINGKRTSIVKCSMACAHDFCNNKQATLHAVEKILKNCAYCKSKIAVIRHNDCLLRVKEQLFVYCKTNCFVKLYFSKNKITLFERGCTSNNHKNITKKSKILELKSLEFNGKYMLISSQCMADIGISCNIDYAPPRGNSNYDKYLKITWLKIMKNASKTMISKCVFCTFKRNKKDGESDCEKGVNMDKFRNFAICESKCYTRIEFKEKYIKIDKGCSQPIYNSYQNVNMTIISKSENQKMCNNGICIVECASKTEYCNINTYIVNEIASEYNTSSRNYKTNTTIDTLADVPENIFEININKIEEQKENNNFMMILIGIFSFMVLLGLSQLYLTRRGKKIDSKMDFSTLSVDRKI